MVDDAFPRVFILNSTNTVILACSWLMI